jgi:glutathione S-transferase
MTLGAPARLSSMLVLYEHPFASYCQKVLIALYELDRPFRAQLVEGEEGRAELAALWPPASIPVLRDEDAGVTVPESTTIIEYVDDGRLIPHLQARIWDRFFDNYVATPMQKIVGDELRPDGVRDAEGVRQAREALEMAYGTLDARLADSRWAAGDTFTLADCAAAPALFYCRAIHRWEQPNVTRYYRDLVGRPSFARVIEEARPYRELFPLPWPADMDELG